MVDQAGPTAEGATSSNGSLTETGCIGHRRMIEHEHPLELDLLSLGLDVLPEYLQNWQRAKAELAEGEG